MEQCGVMEQKKQERASFDDKKNGELRSGKITKKDDVVGKGMYSGQKEEQSVSLTLTMDERRNEDSEPTDNGINE